VNSIACETPESIQGITLVEAQPCIPVGMSATVQIDIPVETFIYFISFNIRTNEIEGTRTCHAQQWPTPPSVILISLVTIALYSVHFQYIFESICVFK
jgi:hypothetical protein